MYKSSIGSVSIITDCLIHKLLEATSRLNEARELSVILANEINNLNELQVSFTGDPSLSPEKREKQKFAEFEKRVPLLENLFAAHNLTYDRLTPYLYLFSKEILSMLVGQFLDLRLNHDVTITARVKEISDPKLFILQISDDLIRDIKL